MESCKHLWPGRCPKRQWDAVRGQESRTSSKLGGLIDFGQRHEEYKSHRIKAAHYGCPGFLGPVVCVLLFVFAFFLGCFRPIESPFHFN